jgi:NAD(P)-dependent dehydrogenase (short-subunit alcohol dehydrogenase family)
MLTHRPAGTFQNMHLNERFAVITGAAGGIGAATARLMAAEGARLVLADIDGDGVERLARSLDCARDDVVAIQVDVSQEADIVRMVQTAVDTFGGIDILHNNATDARAIEQDDDIAALDMLVFDHLVSVNLKAAFMGCKHAIPSMLERGGGAIVNTASIEGFVARGVRPTYGACKAGLVHLAKSVAARYGFRGIRCNAVAPGLVVTPSLEPVYEDAKRVAADLADYAMPRLCTPEDVAKAVVFLASDASSYVNGETLMVDGGASVYMALRSSE